MKTNNNTQASEMSKSNKHQTHLRKDFQTQQQANIRTMKNTLWPLNMKTDENNSKQNTPYPLHIERSISNTISIQTVTKISRKKGKWDWESKTHTFFLMIWIRNEAPMRFENGFTECLERRKFREKMNSYKCSREKLKQVLKLLLFLPNTRISRLD